MEKLVNLHMQWKASDLQETYQISVSNLYKMEKWYNVENINNLSKKFIS
jgi:hypothetical protein